MLEKAKKFLQAMSQQPIPPEDFDAVLGNAQGFIVQLEYCPENYPALVELNKLVHEIEMAIYDSTLDEFEAAEDYFAENPHLATPEVQEGYAKQLSRLEEMYDGVANFDAHLEELKRYCAPEQHTSLPDVPQVIPQQADSATKRLAVTGLQYNKKPSIQTEVVSQTENDAQAANVTRTTADAQSKTRTRKSA